MISKDILIKLIKYDGYCWKVLITCDECNKLFGGCHLSATLKQLGITKYIELYGKDSDLMEALL